MSKIHRRHDRGADMFPFKSTRVCTSLWLQLRQGCSSSDDIHAASILVNVAQCIACRTKSQVQRENKPPGKKVLYL